MMVNIFLNDQQIVTILEANGIEWDLREVTEWSSEYHNKVKPREVERLMALREGEWVKAQEVLSDIIYQKLLNNETETTAT